MEKVYNKLLEQLANMTPEQKAVEWEALKDYNSMGPEVDNYLRSVKGVIVGDSPIVVNVKSSCSIYSMSDFYLAS